MSMFSIRSSMYRFVFLTIVVVAASADQMELRKCRHFLHHPGVMHCCTKFPMEFDMKNSLECHDKTRDPTSCDRELCIGKKEGFIDDDDKLDKVKLEKVMTKAFEGETEIIDAIKTKCIDGDVDEYGPPDFCVLNKLRNCISAQFITKCPEWDETGHCKGVKALVDGCTKLMES